MTKTINPSTQKARRRNLILNMVAARLIGDPTAAWSSIGSAFTGAILPINVNPADLTNKKVNTLIRGILKDFLKTLDETAPIDGVATDAVAILSKVPRMSRGKKK